LRAVACFSCGALFCSGDGTDNFGPIFVVDACGDGLGASGGSDEDEEIHGLADFKAEALEKFVDSGQGIGVRVAVCGERVSGGAFAEAEFVDIAREGCLGDVKAASCEFFSQFILAGDRCLNQEFLNDGMALLFHWVSLYLFRCTAVFNGA
jgi:hypothetical protein